MRSLGIEVGTKCKVSQLCSLSFQANRGADQYHFALLKKNMEVESNVELLMNLKTFFNCRPSLYELRLKIRPKHFEIKIIKIG